MNLLKKNNFPQGVSSAKVVEAFAPYVSELRQARIEAVLRGRLQGIQLAIESPADINNALAAVRSSEALGISRVHIICPRADARYARGITQGAIYWVDVVFYASWAEFLQGMRQTNYCLAGGTVDATMFLSQVPVDKPLCMIIGNEKRGLSPEAQAACDIRYKIPMFGMTESFNLSVSAALSLYDVSQRKRILLGNDSDLTPMQSDRLKAEYYVNSVQPRLSKVLLAKLRS